MSNPEHYSVGWICATTTEFIAAQAFLDENHDDPAHTPSDLSISDYVLGKIGEHNVVLAAPLMREYGACSAACVAEDMIHKFPNIRLSLMVGIGGGAPSRKHDIRLGDIVVNSSGGILLYDFAKTVQSQSFQATGSPHRLFPPSLLRSAVARLVTQYALHGHQLDNVVSQTLEENPQLRKKYNRPGISSDRLYRSDVVRSLDHPDDELPCRALGCDHEFGHNPSCVVSREPRTEYDDNPEIHCGAIASSNQLMNDAVTRDKLATENDILCFEMEADGLTEHFPCLLIRGISGYADSHRNKEWQGYASMVAAAYAKDLLCRISPQQVEKETKIVDIPKERDHGNYNFSFGGNNAGFQMGQNAGCIISHQSGAQEIQSSDSAFFVSPSIRGRPPVSSTGVPKQGSAG